MATAPTFTPAEIAIGQQFFSSNPTGAQIYEKASQFGLSPEQTAGLYQQSMGGDFSGLLGTVNDYLTGTGQTLGGGYKSGLYAPELTQLTPSEILAEAEARTPEGGDPRKTILDFGVTEGFNFDQIDKILGLDPGSTAAYSNSLNPVTPVTPVTPVKTPTINGIVNEIAGTPTAPTTINAPQTIGAYDTSNYFERYFPVTITGGRANPSTALNNVSGQLGLDTILANIQGQYTPQTFTQSGGSYGAGRFIGDTVQAGGVGAPVNQGDGLKIDQPTFKPSVFNIDDYLDKIGEAPTPEPVIVDPAGTSSGTEVDVIPSGGSNVTYDPDDPYNGLFNSLPASVIKGIGLVVPGASFLLGAGNGYNDAIATLALNTGLAAYGAEGFGDVSPAKAAVLGAFGLTPSAIKAAKAFTDNFTDPANLFGYMAAAVDPAISQIAESLIAQSGGTLNADQVGVIGRAIGESINANVAKKMSLNDAVQLSAMEFGVTGTNAAAMAANLNTDDPIGQLISNLETAKQVPAPTPAPTPAPVYTAEQLNANQAFWASNPTPDEIVNAMEVNKMTPEQVSEAWSIATGGDKQVGLDALNQYIASQSIQPEAIYDARLDQGSPQYDPALFNRVMAGVIGSGGTITSSERSGFIPTGLLDTGVVVNPIVGVGSQPTTPLGPLSGGNSSLTSGWTPSDWSRDYTSEFGG